MPENSLFRSEQESLAPNYFKITYSPWVESIFPCIGRAGATNAPVSFSMDEIVWLKNANLYETQCPRCPRFRPGRMRPLSKNVENFS